ncbi:MAG: flagellar hook-associated protein FlgK [Burkholderiales bacterium]
MGNSLYTIGVSGLNAAQAGLLTTSHNIANVNTAGYSRQQVIQSTAPPVFSGGGFLGQGVNVDTVRRVYDAFLTSRVQQTQATSSGVATYAAQTSALNSMFGDSASGLTPVLDAFFAGINGVSANPADMSSRQVMLSDAQALATRFNAMAGQLDAIRTGLDSEIQGAVSDINTLATQIADINAAIGLARAQGGDTRPPNDLLDQRDALLTKLNTQIGATGIVQQDGSLDVYLAHGEPLVVGQTANQLVAQPGNQDPQNLDIALVMGGSNVVFRSGDLQGGILGGALQFRAEVLDPAQDKLGGIAIAVADSINAQHKLGQDLNGNLGGAIFTTPQPLVQGALSNTGTAKLVVGVANAGALTGSNYTISFDGSLYRLTRLSDNTTQTFATLPPPFNTDTGGLSITLSSGSMAAGDSYLIQPARGAARDIGVALTDARSIAAAAPIRTEAALTNTGTGKISAGSVDASYLGSPLTTGQKLPIKFAGPPANTLDFSAGYAGTVTVSGDPGSPYPAAAVKYTAGATYTFGGMSVSITGALKDGDTFTVMKNDGGTGDGRNALLLAALATKSGVVNGTDSLTGANSQLTSFVGSTAQQATAAADAAASLASQAVAAQQAVSGVNLDEEAANLQRYQQAYQASAKVMTVAQSMFDSIMSIFN